MAAWHFEDALDCGTIFIRTMCNVLDESHGTPHLMGDPGLYTFGTWLEASNQKISQFHI